MCFYTHISIAVPNFRCESHEKKIFFRKIKLCLCNLLSHLGYSRLVMRPDYHARELWSRLGGSSWLCNNKILQSSMEWKERKISHHPARNVINPKQLISGRIVGPTVYKNIAEFNKIRTAQGKRQYNHEAKSRWCWQFSMLANRGAVGESRSLGRRGKTLWGKPVSVINTVRKSQAVSHWGPRKFRPSTAYDTFPPHTCVQTQVPGQWQGIKKEKEVFYGLLPYTAFYPVMKSAREASFCLGGSLVILSTCFL